MASADNSTLHRGTRIDLVEIVVAIEFVSQSRFVAAFFILISSYYYLMHEARQLQEDVAIKPIIIL